MSQVKRTFKIHSPLLQAVARAERDGNPILLADDWLEVVSFYPSTDKKFVTVVFKKVVPRGYINSAEEQLRKALSEL